MYRAVRHHSPSKPATIRRLLASVGVACAAASCAHPPAERRDTGALRAEDFRSSAPPTAGSAPPTQPAVITMQDDEEASEGMLTLEALVGPPSDGAGHSSATGHEHPDTADGTSAVTELPVSVGPPGGTPAPGPEGQVIDSLVGQINGQPVYASEFFHEIDRRLATLSEETSDTTVWNREARGIIVRHLGDRIKEELVLAEAQSALTPQQRQGLLAFLQHVRGQIVSGAGGGEAAVDTKLREEAEGKGLDEHVRDVIQTQLMQNEIRTRVSSKVSVSWRDVQLEYQRRFDEFNPPATAVFRAIMVTEENLDAADTIATRLASGDPFADVAKLDANLFNRADGGLLRSPFKGEFVAGEFFAAGLNETARTLAPGQMAGPIAFTGKRAWIYLEAIEPAQTRSLYDVQQVLFREIRQRRFDEEVQRYVLRLIQEGSYSNIESMADRLLAIAIDRYLNAERK